MFAIWIGEIVIKRQGGLSFNSSLLICKEMMLFLLNVTSTYISLRVRIRGCSRYVVRIRSCLWF